MRVMVALLSYDHGIIRIAIDILDWIVKERPHGEKAAYNAQLAEFLKKFIDAFHHAKEEQFLFPFAVNSDPAMAPEIQALILDHSQARLLLSEIVSTLNAPSRSQEFYSLSAEIVRIMTDHINKEELEIFPKIEAILSVREDMRIYQACKEFTDKNFGSGYLRESENFAKMIQDRVLGLDIFKV